ncbi:MAG TPA: V4R domain-containing protein [Kofleriaceae bacterium]|nr:V4R domain-containing protein [Kofleriaceae bacterium]
MTDLAAAKNDAENRVDIKNALSIIRPKLGDRAGVALYRLLRLVALEDIIGRGAGATAYVAGKKLGVNLGLTKLDDFLALCDAISLGIIVVPVMTASRIHVDVYECVTCSGMKPVGRMLCQFEAGLVAGAVQTITGKQTKAREVTCIGGLGHDTCGVEVQF